MDERGVPSTTEMHPLGQLHKSTSQTSFFLLPIHQLHPALSEKQLTYSLPMKNKCRGDCISSAVTKFFKADAVDWTI